jgi:hypothetical protein
MPQRVVGNIEIIASALLSLQRDTPERLASVDERVGALILPLNALDRKVTDLRTLERSLTDETGARLRDTFTSS